MLHYSLMLVGVTKLYCVVCRWPFEQDGANTAWVNRIGSRDTSDMLYMCGYLFDRYRV